MTGLDLATDALIEISALVTDGELNILGDGVDLVIHAPEEKLVAMPPIVQAMHAKSGLTEEVRASTVTLADAEAAVLEYVRQHVPADGRPLLAGNSIATDRGFIDRDMPTFAGFLHYRMIDVSTIKELTRRWYPQVYSSQPDKGMAHRALADIKESIRELAYYRAAVFVPTPGPTAESAAGIAGALGAPA
jgi:oligoribonuclease